MMLDRVLKACGIYIAPKATMSRREHDMNKRAERKKKRNG